MDAAQSSVRISIKQDGIYLIIDNTLETAKPSRMEVLQILEDYGVQDVDFAAISEMFKRDESIVEQKISTNVNINQEPEKIEVTVEKSGLTAHVKFIAAVNNGAALTLDDIKRAIETAGVRYGLQHDIIEQLMKNRMPNNSYLVAMGSEPVQGTDGSLKMHFDTSPKKIRPKELEDGKVDYHNLNLIEIVVVNQKLVSLVPEVLGIDGMDVYNVPIPAKKVKPAPPLPRGKGTKISDNGSDLLAEINGQVVYDGKRVTVLPVLEIAGNVDNSTGDIIFNGAVVIRGNVVTGFQVIADGNIDIRGVVEGAIIKSKENIVISGGIQGQEKAEITAGGNLTVRFAESCTLSSGGNIIADSIMHSNVKCTGHLELSGKKGLLVGGKIIVGTYLRAFVIGSNMATATYIEAGFNPDVLIHYKELLEAYNLAKNEYDKMSNIVEALNAQNQITPLSEDKKRILLKSVHTKMFLREKFVSAQEKVNKIAPLLTQSEGAVYARDVVRTGVKIMIGNAVLHVRDDIQHCKLSNIDSKIHISVYS